MNIESVWSNPQQNRVFMRNLEDLLKSDTLIKGTWNAHNIRWDDDYAGTCEIDIDFDSDGEGYIHVYPAYAGHTFTLVTPITIETWEA